ncbi:sugar transferase [Campylobacter sp. JMF_02 ED1]|uniref:sugar transferase n=1 Tax=unclassified Campylobacter TaxID=2593542 RepID=UPI0022E9F4C5|nr:MULTISPECIES: sugar transferase [unclassified Campylobacter]MDA3048781.1 sugar transferase [Campylobacter sp. JMF_15 NE4]MDA3050507.1 sugar transferase [Campylobacter sp. JMF_02 ED1]
MKKFYAMAILLMADVLCILISFFIAVSVRNLIEFDFAGNTPQHYSTYIGSFFIYVLIIGTLAYRKIYTKRYDFWHESYIIFSSSLFALVMIFFLLAINKNVSHSRFVIFLAFGLCAVLIPMCKFFLKKYLYRVGIWQKNARVINGDKEFRREIFKNHYLGYKFTRGDDYETVFIANKNLKSIDELNRLVEENVIKNREVIFTPALQGYDFAGGEIFSLFNSRTNLFLLENSLLKPINYFMKGLVDYIVVLLALPFLVVAFFVIFVLMKIEEPKGKILFSQPRAGRNNRPFNCFKFRSMRENGDEILRDYLQKNPDEVEFFDKYHKYKNDPRITKIGNFMRKTSLDELPQLINVLKGDMSIVGPRPFVVGERENGGISQADMKILLHVKPGVTGLAQVMGRGDTDFKIRAKMDIWYVKNWTLYTDFVIILKTIKAVLFREGAS